MYKLRNYNNIISKHYLNPGKNLSDLELIKLYNSMIQVNTTKNQNVDNLYLKKGHSLSELRVIYNNCIITLLSDQESPFGFLVSPILKTQNGHLLHAGLIIFSRNPGGDFLQLVTLENFTMAYRSYGKILVTNITSTPSIIEVFSNTVNRAWPSPKMNTKICPKEYRNAIVNLKEQYMDRYFPEDSKVEINSKRFTMTSNSNDMGFSTNYYELSRATKYIYQSFCKTWINYDKSEDVIQVGEINLFTYINQILKLIFLKIKIKKIIKKDNNQAVENTSKQAA